MFFDGSPVCRTSNLTTSGAPCFSADLGPAQREMVSLAGGDAPKNQGQADPPGVKI